MSKLCPPRVNPDVNYGLRVRMTCQCGFINCNRCTTVVWDGDGGSFVCGGTESVEQEQTVLSALFCCDSKTAQNIKSIKIY